MRYGSGEFDMTHSLSSDFRFGNFDAALFADDTFISYSFIFTAVALPVLGRSENSLAVQTVFLGFLRAVVNGLGAGNLAVRPLSYLFGRRHAYLYGIEIVKFKHSLTSA